MPMDKLFTFAIADEYGARSQMLTRLVEARRTMHRSIGQPDNMDLGMHSAAKWPKICPTLQCY